MKHLKYYKQYKESIVIDLQFSSDTELMESLSIWHDALLSSINAEEIDLFDTLKLDKEFYNNRLDLDFLHDNIEFINSLSSIALKKSETQNTDDYSTFINKPCKFMFIYGMEMNELENPIYMLLQVWNETLKKWDDVKLYKVNENINRFYDKLSSKTIELLDGDDNYIYSTSNGNEWVLQNSEKENDVYKKVFRNTKLEDFLKKNKIKVNIIGKKN